MSRLIHPRLDDVPLPSLLHALSDAGRLAILRRLYADHEAGGQGMCCSAASPSGMPRATISGHFGVLRSAGLIRGEKRGVQTINRLRLDEVERRFPGVLAPVLAAAEGEVVD